ncbi:MAG: hypothetical protein FJ288_03655, partial [Planctomycetes bacterium]|nr:hypothetical protein [Planctomycetota bacterium]
MPTITRHRARLGDLLVQRGVITEEQLAAALAAQQRGQQQRLLGEILVDLGHATKEQVLSAVAESCGVPFARLVPQLVDPAVRGSLAESFIQKHGVLPLFKVRDVLTVATSEPSNLFLMDEISHAAGLSAQLVAATPDNVYQMIEYASAERKESPPAEDPPSEDRAALDDVVLAEDYDTAYGNWPPEKVAALLVREAVRARASAIHLEPDEKVLRVRFRADGVLHVVMRPPARLGPGLVGALEEMLGAPGAAAGTCPGRSARVLVQGRAVQLHMAAIVGAFGPCVTVRLVRDDEAQRTLDKLGADFELLARYRRIIEGVRGLVLLAGPRESGLTTTLYATLHALDPIRLNICTFESYVHYNLPGVSQFSPAACGAADAEAALGRLLGQQPDVVALDGEMGGGAAAAAAARAGRLVLARVRAIDAADAIAQAAARVPADVIGGALRAVLAQR